MRRISGRGVVALEEEEVAAVAAAEAPAMDNAESLETDMLEVSESAAEQGEEDAQVEEAAEVVEALESIAECLKVSAANGGLDRHSAAAIGVATQYMYSRVGIKSKSMPAMESFGGTSSRVGATQLAMEDIKDKAKEIWASIVAAFKRMLAWVTDHFNKIFGSAEKLQKRAQAVVKMAEDKNGKKAEKTKFEGASLVKALRAGPTDIGDVKAGMDKVLAHAKFVLDTHAQATIANGDKIVEAIGDKAKAEAIKLVPAAGKEVTGDEYGKAPEGTKYRTEDGFLGNKVWFTCSVQNPVQGDTAMALFGKIKEGMQPAAGDKDPTKTEVSVIDPGKAEAIAKVVEALGAELQTFRKTNTKLQELLKKAIAAAEAASKSADTEEDKEKKAYALASRSAIGNMPKFIIGGVKSVAEYSLITGKAALDLCEQSMKQYK